MEHLSLMLFAREKNVRDKMRNIVANLHQWLALNNMNVAPREHNAMDVRTEIGKLFGWISAGRLQDVTNAEVVENDQDNAASGGVIATVVRGEQITPLPLNVDPVESANNLPSKNYCKQRSMWTR